MTLLTFLLCARQLLWKSRRVLLGENSPLEISPYLLADTTQQVNNANNSSSNVNSVLSGNYSSASVRSSVMIPGGINANSGTNSSSSSSYGASVSGVNNAAGNANTSVHGSTAGSNLTTSQQQQRRSVNDIPSLNAAAATAAAAATNNSGNASNNNSNAPSIANNNINSAAGTGGMAGSDANYMIWQAEMEKGYETLVNAIFPYISDLREAASLAPRNR